MRQRRLAIAGRRYFDDRADSPNGVAIAVRQALDKLGVRWEPTEAERAYNEGRSTQVLVNPAVRVKGRFSRRLREGNTELVLQRQPAAGEKPLRSAALARREIQRALLRQGGGHRQRWQRDAGRLAKMSAAERSAWAAEVAAQARALLEAPTIDHEDG
jgi:hypothetical protein